MINRPAFEAFLQIDIAQNAIEVFMERFNDSEINDPEMKMAYLRIKHDLKLIDNSLRVYLGDVLSKRES